MTNYYKQFADLFPQPPLQIGTVTAFSNGVATVSLLGGGKVTARVQSTTVGQQVFVRDGVVEGNAPNLTAVSINV